MQPEYQIKLPWPPSANTYYRRSGHHIHLSKNGRAFKQAVKDRLTRLNLHEESIASRLKVSLSLCPPNRRKFDLDNRIKPTLDALQNAGLFIDDEQIDQLDVERLPIDDNKQGYCRVTVTALA